MKKIYNYIMLFTLAFVAVCCSEEVIDAPTTSAKTGDEVQFGLSLEGASRTVYGTEADNAFPIYWVDGDKVQIFSPQALEGKRNAEYQVSVGGATEQNYANSLTITGDYGVQWGEKKNSYEFYSLYPSGDYTLSTDGTKAENIQISYSQTINVTTVDGKEVIKSDMEDCLMYAKTVVPGVDAEGNDNRGTTVNLQYNPISTVLMLTVKVAENQQGTDADNFTIQSIRLIAPEGTNIAGTFSLNIEDGTFGAFAAGKSSNVVMAQITNTTTGGYHTLANNESFQVPLFIAPVAGLNAINFKVQVVANGNTYTKTLNIDKALTPGQIHKITLPELKPATTEWEVSKWMTYIPRNVYLSEISIPGTWNSLNSDCQSVTTIASQYDLGVRAFHLDTRWSTTEAAGHSFTDPYYLLSELSSSNMYLSVADGGSGRDVRERAGLGVIGAAESLGQIMDQNNTSFEDYLGQITENVQPDEYMILFCTFAQGSYNDVAKTGKTWMQAISDACAANGKVYNASGLNANTLVGDVLNHVIVVVNLDVSVDAATLPSNSKCLFTYVPMKLPSDHYTDASAAGHVDALYYSTKASAGISMYTSHAQISTTGNSAVDCGNRGYSHPLANRDALVNSIWDRSKSNYGTPNYAHDKWIYLGLGGYIMTSSGSSGSGYDTVENRYAPMIYDRIEEMGQNNVPYYPLGIILMNNKMNGNYKDGNADLGYGFSDVCKEILLLNNKYRLQYDPSKPSDYNPNATSQASYSATATNGGNAFDTK